MKIKNRFDVIKTTDWLGQKYGGKWKYNRSSGDWERTDGTARVARLLTGRDHTGEFTGETSMCMYFNDGRPPQWVR